MGLEFKEGQTGQTPKNEHLFYFKSCLCAVFSIEFLWKMPSLEGSLTFSCSFQKYERTQSPYFDGLKVNKWRYPKWIKYFFSQNLIEHKLHEWPGERFRPRWASSYCFSTDISCQMWSLLNNNWSTFVEFKKKWYVKYRISIVYFSFEIQDLFCLQLYFDIQNTENLILVQRVKSQEMLNILYILWQCLLNIKHTLLLHLFNVHILLDLQKSMINILTQEIVFHQKK
jgi:hypothetical protein